MSDGRAVCGDRGWEDEEGGYAEESDEEFLRYRKIWKRGETVADGSQGIWD